MHARAIPPILTFEKYRIRMVAFLAAVFTASLFCYGIFLLLAVEHTAARTQDESAIATISGELGSLESQYLALTEQVTPQQVTALGLVTPKSVATIFVNPTQGLAFIHGNE